MGARFLEELVVHPIKSAQAFYPTTYVVFTHTFILISSVINQCYIAPQLSVCFIVNTF